jgi:hypothetical protein
VVPSCSTKFGCEAAPLAAARADNDECPTSAQAAAGNARWAAARFDTIKDEDLTVGLFYDADGTEHRFMSGRDREAETALKVGRKAGVFPSQGRFVVADHVEVKVAAAMREADVTFGVLVINNSGGPCRLDDNDEPEPLSCLAIVPKLLPREAKLTVWWPAEDMHSMKSRTLTGEE